MKKSVVSIPLGGQLSVLPDCFPSNGAVNVSVRPVPKRLPPPMGIPYT